MTNELCCHIGPANQTNHIDAAVWHPFYLAFKILLHSTTLSLASILIAHSASAHRLASNRSKSVLELVTDRRKVLEAFTALSRQTITENKVKNMGQGDRFGVWTGPNTDMDEESLAACATIVKAGGAVQTALSAVREAIADAQLIALIRERETEKIVAVGAIKADRPSYRRRQFRNANIPIDGYENAAEIGYIAVDDAFQGNGLSAKIMHALGVESRKLFATTDNIRMKRTLAKSQFYCVGTHWKGGRGALSLWVKD